MIAENRHRNGGTLSLDDVRHSRWMNESDKSPVETMEAEIVPLEGRIERLEEKIKSKQEFIKELDKFEGNDWTIFNIGIDHYDKNGLGDALEYMLESDNVVKIKQETT